MILTIVIPAYNEEDAIESIIERCLAARAEIVAKTEVDTVEVIVVSDGSYDRTVERASKYDEIKLISYEKNKGYGAAIKIGFSQGKGELVSFLDADGTCNPLFFIDLVNLLSREKADVALGSRLNENSEMPKIRRFGNKIFVNIINFFAGSSITDSASGMRVIRREALRELSPLPDGLHYTPAMSCKAVMDKNIKIVEIPMPYKERIGESKLSVVQDGLRFLKIIIDVAMTYVPQKLFGPLGLLFLLFAFILGFKPLGVYISEGIVPEDMLYRLISIIVLGVTGSIVLLIGQISNEVCALINPQSEKNRLLLELSRKVFNQVFLIVLGICLFIIGLALSLGTVLERYYTGYVDLLVHHWAYMLLGGFLILLGVSCGSLGILLRIVLTLRSKMEAFRNMDSQ